MKVENNNSKWKFWDLFDLTVKNLNNREKHSDDSMKADIERILVRFLERLPTGDYKDIREEWNKR